MLISCVPELIALVIRRLSCLFPFAWYVSSGQISGLCIHWRLAILTVHGSKSQYPSSDDTVGILQSMLKYFTACSAWCHSIRPQIWHPNPHGSLTFSWVNFPTPDYLKSNFSWVILIVSRCVRQWELLKFYLMRKYWLENVMAAHRHSSTNHRIHRCLICNLAVAFVPHPRSAAGVRSWLYFRPFYTHLVAVVLKTGDSGHWNRLRRIRNWWTHFLFWNSCNYRGRWGSQQSYVWSWTSSQ